MNEQQKALREGLMKLYCKACYDEDADPFYDTWEACYEEAVCAFCTESVVDPFLAFLSEQGCVLKVKGELPELQKTWDKPLTMEDIGWLAQMTMVSHGFTAVAPIQ